MNCYFSFINTGRGATKVENIDGPGNNTNISSFSKGGWVLHNYLFLLLWNDW